MRNLRLAALTVLAGAVVGVVAAVSSATHKYSGGAQEVVIVSDGPGGNAECPKNTIKGAKVDPGAN
jgi:hypothetical protein